MWNASRFVLGQIGNSKLQITNNKFDVKKLTAADRKILKSLDKTIKSINTNLERFQFGRAAHVLYNFFWHDFCDVYIEKSKFQKDKKNTQEILLYLLLTSLKLLHPFIPFITEEIYQKLPLKDKKGCLMIEKWPC